MVTIYERPKSLTNRPTGYCPGCLHGIATRLLCELIDELGVRAETVAVLPVGCGTLGMFHFNTNVVVSPHGRTPAVATGVKRSRPEKLVFSYQGDGDLAAIGLAEIMHAANRGENFTVVFINNGTYGMTGGQLAPTTLAGQKSTTSPEGRDTAETGHPMLMCELLSQLRAPRYIARFSLDSPANIVQAKKGLRKAFELQRAGKGFTFVELLSNCPTNWGLSPLESLDWMRENTLKVFPPGVYRDEEA